MEIVASVSDAVDSNAVDVEVSTEVGTLVESTPPVDLGFEDNNYVIASVASSGFSKGSAVPEWLSSAISDGVGAGVSELQGTIDILKAGVKTLDEGFSSVTATLSTPDSRLVESITSEVAALNNSIAVVADAQSSFVSRDEAKAAASEVLNTEFNTPGSDTEGFVLGLTSSLSNDVGTLTTTVDAMQSTFNDLNTVQSATGTALDTGFTRAGIDPVSGELVAGAGKFGELQAAISNMSVSLVTRSGVSAGQFIEWGEDSIPEIGMIHTERTVDGAVTNAWQWLGGTEAEGYAPTYVDADGNSYELGWRKINLDVNDTGWAAGASSFAVGNNGEITGWSYSGSSAAPSVFNISAGSFTVDDGTGTGVPAFNVTGGSVSLGGSLTVSGDIVTTGKIQKPGGLSFFDINNDQIKMHTKNADGTDKFVLDSTAAGTAIDPNIKGAYIQGATIEGGEISGVTLKAGSVVVDSVGSTATESYTGPVSVFQTANVAERRVDQPTTTTVQKINMQFATTVDNTIKGPKAGSGYHPNRLCKGVDQKVHLVIHPVYSASIRNAAQYIEIMDSFITVTVVYNPFSAPVVLGSYFGGVDIEFSLSDLGASAYEDMIVMAEMEVFVDSGESYQIYLGMQGTLHFNN